MVSYPTTNLLSLANIDEAAAYLGDSVRGTSWDGLDPDSQSRNLITATRLLDRQRWEGTLSGLRIVRTAVVAAGGTGYSVGAVLTVSGGTGDDPARAKVLTLSGSVVATVQLVDAGGYTVDPSGTAATSASAGTGCTLTLTMGAQVLTLPRSGMTDRYDTVVASGVVPPELVQACMELAYELSIDPKLEGKVSTAAALLKRVKAGSAEAEFFAPGAFVPITRFPAAVQELIAPFLLGSGDAVAGIGASFASGTDAESQFDDCDNSSLTEGFG
jgi:hypothetical protein